MPSSSRVALLKPLLALLIPVAIVIAIFIYVFTPTEASSEDAEIRESGITTVGEPLPGQAVMVPERRAVAKQGMQDVWHVVYSYTVDGEDYTVIGNEDFLDEESAVAASNTGRSIEVKYLERNPEAATAQDFD